MATPKIKQVTIRWPETFWEIVAIASKQRRTSVQALVTKAVARELRISPPAEA